MNKKTIKIAGWALGLSMAVAGIGVAVGASYALGGNEPIIVHADAAYTWQKITSTSEFTSGTTLLVTQGGYYLDASQAATSNTPKMVALTLSNGLPTLTADSSKCLAVTAYNNEGLRLYGPGGKNYLYTNTSNSGTRIGTGSENGSLWTIEATNTAGEFYLKSNASTARYLSRYGTNDFRSYTNTETNANLVLYKLVEQDTEFTVTYDGNGSTGGTAPIDDTTYTSSNKTVTVLDNDSLVKANASPVFNYTFGGWNTRADGKGTTYDAGETFTITADTTLYAIWNDPRTVVTLSAEDALVYVDGDDVIPVITSSPTGHTSGYTLTSASTDKITIVDNKLHAVAKGDSEITVHIDDDSEYIYLDTTFTATARVPMGASGTGTIEFGSSPKVPVSEANVEGEDDKGNIWTVTTVGTTSFTPANSQIGSSSKPATSITFTTTLPEEYKITNMTASFGGFSGTEGTVTMKVGDTTVGAGSLNGTSDVSVEQSDSATGNVLTVTVTDIAKGVKVYGISYSYLKEVHVTGVELNSSSVDLIPNATHQLTATVLPANATDKSVSYATSNDSVATVSKTGLITAVGDGDATITVTSTDGGKTATCTVHVETPAGAYVTIEPTAMGIVDGNYVELAITYGGAFSDELSVVSSNDNVEVILDDNGNGTGTVTVSFEKAGTSVISFKDGEAPIEGAGSTCNVTVLEKLNAITAKEKVISDLNFTQSYASGGATASDGASWAVTSDGSESNFDGGSGIHYGTSSASVKYLQLATSGITGAINKVVVNARDAQSVATVSVSVGGKAFTCTGSSDVSNTSKDFEFTGSGSGQIVVKVERPSSQTKAIYVKSVKVTYLSAEGLNVANTNVAVQKEVLDFVGTMNGDLSVCDPSKTLSTAVWSGLANKFETALDESENSDLFGKMFQFADSTPRDGSGNADTGDSLQNALARYDYILEKYGTEDYEDFLGRVESAKVVPATQGANLWNVSASSDQNSAFAIAAVLGTGVLAAGGFAFLRRKKEDR